MALPVDRPLAGLQVLDFSRLLPGPYCTLLLGYLGATVLKVEDPATGDLARRFPPLVDGIGAIFTFLNREKQSIALDLKRCEGQAIAQELAARSDIVVEGFRPGVAARLGIDFPTLAARNGRLVYCSISGYGQTGPLRDLPGHDLTYAGMSGLLDALSPGAPTVPGVQLVDAAAALLALVHILAALRPTQGGAQYLDVSLLDAAYSLMPGILVEARAGPSDGLSVMDFLRGSERNNLYRCADGRWLALTPLEEPFWQRLRSTLVAEGMIEEGEVPTVLRLREVFARRSGADWFSTLAKAGVPCAPVNMAAEVLGHRAPVEPPEWAAGFGEPAPLLGQHTDGWLRALGYSQDEMARLEDEGVIYRSASAEGSLTPS